MRAFNIQVMWDSEAKVWVATSDEVPGLATEADSLDRLFAKLCVMVPELLEANGVVEANVPVELLALAERDRSVSIEDDITLAKIPATFGFLPRIIVAVRNALARVSTTSSGFKA